MATYSSHRLILRKWKLTVSAVLLEIFEIFVSQICLVSRPSSFMRLLPKSLNLIGCRGDMKGKFLKKILKNLLHRNHKGVKLKFGIHASFSLLFSCQIRTLVVMATFIFHRFII